VIEVIFENLDLLIEIVHRWYY